MILQRGAWAALIWVRAFSGRSIRAGKSVPKDTPGSDEFVHTKSIQMPSNHAELPSETFSDYFYGSLVGGFLHAPIVIFGHESMLHGDD